MFPFLIGTTYNSIEYVCSKFWQSLTPGNKIIETVLIVSNLIAFAICIFVMYEFSEMINKTIIDTSEMQIYEIGKCFVYPTAESTTIYNDEKTTIVYGN